MLEYLLRLKGVTGPRGLGSLCDELLDRVNLSFAARRKVKTYSGGMRQRLGIAQAIAGNPRLIIVDEPTAGLDPEERLRFYRLLSELAADRIVLLSTHIVEDVAVLCPRFAVIREGRLVAYTTPSEATRAIEGTIFEGSISAETLRPTACRSRSLRHPGLSGRGTKPCPGLSAGGKPLPTSSRSRRPRRCLPGLDQDRPVECGSNDSIDVRRPGAEPDLANGPGTRRGRCRSRKPMSAAPGAAGLAAVSTVFAR